MEFVAKSKIPTKFGEFCIYAFKEKDNEHIVLANKEPKEGMLVRVHSKCLTGDTLGSLRCDCREQLEASMAQIGNEGGMIIYLDQEGRGIGLANKIKAYSLQDNGIDTVDANKKLGFNGDDRDYKVAAKIIEYFGIKKIKLLTNNPNKMKGLEENGIVVERISLTIKPNQYNRQYLKTKREKLDHLV
ncbi:MAG: GTP cyclohydrolase II [Candidatus Micrarchaeota archaeon]